MDFCHRFNLSISLSYLLTVFLALSVSIRLSLSLLPLALACSRSLSVLLLHALTLALARPCSVFLSLFHSLFRTFTSTKTTTSIKKNCGKKRRKIFIPSQGPCDPCSNNKKLKGCCKDHEGSLKHKHRDSMTEDMVLLRLKNVWFE